MKAVQKASYTQTEGFWHGSTEMSRHIAKPDHTGRTLGDMTEGRSEAEGHRRLHTRMHRRDSLSERDQVHGLARTMFVCDAPPLGRRPEHRIDRLTPICPQMGRLLDHGVSANGLTRCMQARSAPARAECAGRRAFKVHAHCLCGCIGNCILARAPIRPNSAWKALGVIGPSRSVIKTCEDGPCSRCRRRSAWDAGLLRCVSPQLYLP